VRPSEPLSHDDPNHLATASDISPLSVYLPPSLRYLELMRTVPGEPMEHAPFEYDLVEALRPRIVVDVGAGAATSFSILCQSIRDHDVSATAYAIDTWDDDAGKGEDDPGRWSAVNHFLHTYFRGIAYILKMPLAEATAHFRLGSVGLLRIDAVRAGVPLAGLLATWMPFLAPEGVLLCPGVGDASRPDLGDDFARATSGFTTCTFALGRGLGVARAASAAEHPELLRLLAHEPSELARFYAHASEHHALRREVLAQKFDLSRKKPAK
jgi:hypothetical protein